MFKKVSVALATYNGANFIAQQLQSIINQSQAVDEIIVTDDCSTDNTIEIVSEFAERYSDICWNIAVNESNLGFRKNFRNALGKCTGDVIFFCDQDDIWREDKVKITLSAMEQNAQIMLLLSDFKTIDSNGNYLQPDKTLENIVLPDRVMCNNEQIVKIKIYEAFAHSLGQGCAMAITKELANLFMETELNWAHDNLAGVIAAFRGGAYYIKEQLIKYRLHGNNTIRIPIGKYGTRENTFLEKCEMLVAVLKRYLFDMSGTECREQIYNKNCYLFENVEEMVGCNEAEKLELQKWRKFEIERLEAIKNKRIFKYFKMRIKNREYFKQQVPICTFEQRAVRIVCDIGAMTKK